VFVIKAASLQIECSVMVSLALTMGLSGCAPSGEFAQPIGMIELSSDYEPLVDGFAWAKAQALDYVFEGDPVGSWYEAALPRREAFCMRDVSHQATGALALGLSEHTRNMMHKFAVNISGTRRWCSYWEINRYDEPAPVDYRSDDDFWYNLPANFDVIQAVYGIYEWTGDEVYLTDSIFRNFYRRSLVDYVASWDEDGDGIMESAAENGYQGIPTYWEGAGPRALTGADLVASQYAANAAFAAMLELNNEPQESAEFAATAERLKSYFNEGWWNASLGRFHTSIIAGGVFDTTLVPLLQILPLYFDIVEQGERRELLLDNLSEGSLVEVNVYLAEVYYSNGRSEEGFRYLMRQMDPALSRREYPENPFTAVGTTVQHLMGIEPQASTSLVETMPSLTSEVSWVRVDHLPVFSNQISVRHDRLTETRFENESGGLIRWRAVFPGLYEGLLVGGELTTAESRRGAGGDFESFVVLQVPPGNTVTVAVPRSQNR
jgi:hypothetical protein